MIKYIVLFLISMGLSLLFVPFAKFLAHKIGAIDIPNERKIHKEPIPRLGGLAIALAFIITFMIASLVPIYSRYLSDFAGSKQGLLLLALLILLGIGIIDDKKGLKPGIKFLFQFAAGFLVYLADLESKPFPLCDLLRESSPVRPKRAS